MTREHDKEREQVGKPDSAADDCFGSCPVCGRNDGFVNIGKERWFFCDAHKSKWCIGSNWFRCRPDETPEDWRRNSAKLESYEEVPARRPKPDARTAPAGRVGDEAEPGTESKGDWWDEEDFRDSFYPLKPSPPIFEIGLVYATPGALEHLDGEQLPKALHRHGRGDWGDVGEADRRENDLSAREGYRVLSSYTADDGTKFWVITEADRSSTTVLLPDEY